MALLDQVIKGGSGNTNLLGSAGNIPIVTYQGLADEISLQPLSNIF
jgi:hypothetical protein